MNFIALDFETANRERSSICAVGLAIVENGQLVDTKYLLTKPFPNYYDHWNVAVHGITDADTRELPTFAAQWPELRQYFDGKTMIAHNAAFDFSVLRAALSLAALPCPALDYHCTLSLSKAALPLSHHKLSDVSRYFDIELDHHHAGSDARACALIALELCKRYECTSLEELSARFRYKIGNIQPDGSYRAFSRR